MAAEGVPPNVPAYSAAISACDKAPVPQARAALGLLERMRRDGLRGDVILYSAVMGACGKAGLWEAAVQAPPLPSRAGAGGGGGGGGGGGVWPVFGMIEREWGGGVGDCRDTQAWIGCPGQGSHGAISGVRDDGGGGGAARRGGVRVPHHGPPPRIPGARPPPHPRRTSPHTPHVVSSVPLGHELLRRHRLPYEKGPCRGRETHVNTAVTRSVTAVISTRAIEPLSLSPHGLSIA